MSKKRTHPEYVLRDGMFVLVSPRGADLLITSSVWMMINIKTGIILSHGARAVVGSEFDALQDSLRKHKSSEALSLANQVVLCNVTELPIDEINLALSTEGYILEALSRFGIKTCREWIG